MPARTVSLAQMVAHLRVAEFTRNHDLANRADGPWQAYDSARADINEDRADDLLRLLGVARDTVAVIDALARAFADTATAHEVGPRCNCGEADAVARVLRHGSDPSAAVDWLTGHTNGLDDTEGDDGGDAHYGQDLTGYLDALAAEDNPTDTEGRRA